MVCSVPFNIGVSSSPTCVNLDCLRPLSDFELKRQSRFTIKHFFCIKCRTKGQPNQGDIVRVKCVHCGAIKKIWRLGQSLMCENCLAIKRKKRDKARIIKKKRDWEHELRKVQRMV